MFTRQQVSACKYFRRLWTLLSHVYKVYFFKPTVALPRSHFRYYLTDWVALQRPNARVSVLRKTHLVPCTSHFIQPQAVSILLTSGLASRQLLALNNTARKTQLQQGNVKGKIHHQMLQPVHTLWAPIMVDNHAGPAYLAWPKDSRLMGSIPNVAARHI